MYNKYLVEPVCTTAVVVHTTIHVCIILSRSATLYLRVETPLVTFYLLQIFYSRYPYYNNTLVVQPTNLFNVRRV